MSGPDPGNYSPGQYRDAAKEFLRSRIGEETYNLIMKDGIGEKYPYVAARIYLSPEEWEQYVWIEHHGSLRQFRAKERER